MANVIRAERNGRGNEALRNVRGAKQLGGERIDRKRDDE